MNGEDLRDATHDRAIQVLRQTPAEVKIIVFRDESLLKDQDSYDVFTVELLKKPNKGLGLSIVGKRNDTGVFISDIVSVRKAQVFLADAAVQWRLSPLNHCSGLSLMWLPLLKRKQGRF